MLPDLYYYTLHQLWHWACIRTHVLSSATLLSVCTGCDAAAAARTGLPAHKHCSAPWPETRKHPGQQPWGSQDRRLWTGTHLHLQHRSHSRCKWGNTQGKRLKKNCVLLIVTAVIVSLAIFEPLYIALCSVCSSAWGENCSCVTSPTPGCVSLFLLLIPPSLCSGGDAVVQSPRGAAELCLHVLSGHVERRLHLRWALPPEVRSVEEWHWRVKSSPQLWK